MKEDRLRHLAEITVVGIGAILLLYLFFQHIFIITLPFLISWGVAFSIKPLAERISVGTKIPYRIISVVLTVLMVLGGMAIFISIIFYAVREAWGFLSGLNENDALYDALMRIVNLGGFFGDREGAAELEAEISGALKGMITSFLSRLVSGLTSFISSIPKVLIFVLVTVISSVYFSLDLDNINRFVKARMPSGITSRLIAFKNEFLSALVKYLRSYLMLMLITFIIMLFGFLVIGVKYAVLFAFVVALLDALPLIGVGTVLIPWSLYQMIFSDFGMGIGLLVLFAVNLVIRQFVEPKIVGKNLGIHPVVSLILLYVGYHFFGFFGLLLIPFMTVILNTVFKREEDVSQ